MCRSNAFDEGNKNKTKQNEEKLLLAFRARLETTVI